MNIYQFCALLLIVLFRSIFYLKAQMLKRTGIATNHLSKGNKDTKTLKIEKALRIATFAIIPVQIGSIVLNTRLKDSPIFPLIGIVLTVGGVSVFAAAVLTMGDNWRAGIPEHTETILVKHGIYRFCRNPAFLGFDIYYLGLTIAFPNAIHILVCCFVIFVFHLQILQEENHLSSVYGKEYQDYKAQTGRYLPWV